MGDQKKQPDYEVGYGKPPKAHQFKPKHTKSKGSRRKKRLSVQAIVEAELMSMLAFTEGGKTLKLPKLQLIVKRLVHKAMSGDDRSIATALAVARTHLPQPAEEEGEDIPLTDAERAVLNNIIASKAIFAGKKSDE